jgi:hypothetical protein
MTEVIMRKGEVRLIGIGDERRCVQKKDVIVEFDRKHKGGERHDVAFKRSWEELVKKELVSWTECEEGPGLDVWVYLEKGYE